MRSAKWLAVLGHSPHVDRLSESSIVGAFELESNAARDSNVI
jgi:hypothetical protein